MLRRRMSAEGRKRVRVTRCRVAGLTAVGIVFFVLILADVLLYCPEGELHRVKVRLTPDSKEILTSFKVAGSGDYLLKTRYEARGVQDVAFYLNGVAVAPNTWPGVVKRDEDRLVYIRIAQERLAQVDDVEVRIVFSQYAPQEVSIGFSNYRKELDAGLYVVFSPHGWYSLAVTQEFIALAAVFCFASVFGLCLISDRLFELCARILKQSFYGLRPLLFLAVVVINLIVFWPAFFHLFRHDEWFLFFASRNDPADFGFFLKHIDWQLYLPYDRLMFRPIQHAMLAFNRVLFNADYVGPHVLTFIKHLTAVACLWWLLIELRPKAISVFFALLFSVLVVNVDPVIWPHVDAYIVATIFMILAIVIFRKTVIGRIPTGKGLLLTAALLLLNLLTSEITFLMPMIFFICYRCCSAKSGQTHRSCNKASWLLLIVPYGLWAVLFAIHIWRAYPDFRIGAQSQSAGLVWSFVNMVRLPVTMFSAMLVPLAEEGFRDKIYIGVTLMSFLLAGAILIISFVHRRRFLRGVSWEGMLIVSLFVSIVFILCFGRAGYIQSMLDSYNIVCHYSYPLTVLTIAFVYLLLDFERIRASRQLTTLLIFSALLLTGLHCLKTRVVIEKVEDQTSVLKTYFNAVRSFVHAHERETDFSFKVIDRPPRIEVFHWYSQTCIDGLFNRYLSAENPKYVLEYDYEAEDLIYFPYDVEPVAVYSSASGPPDNIDYVNALGMPFQRFSKGKEDIWIGATEVTQAQWENVMGFNPSKFQNDNHPVHNVPYHMVERFIGKLNAAQTGFYYRLPTESECVSLLSPASIEYHDMYSNLEEYAWLYENAAGRTHSAASLAAVAGGIYDILGNVWEWTSTPIHKESPAADFDDNPRICFGLSWRDNAAASGPLTTNYRPDFRHEHLGFRLVRCPGDARSEKENER